MLGYPLIPGQGEEPCLPGLTTGVSVHAREPFTTWTGGGTLSPRPNYWVSVHARVPFNTWTGEELSLPGLTAGVNVHARVPFNTWAWEEPSLQA